MGARINVHVQGVEDINETRRFTKSEARKLTWTKPKVAPEPRPTVCVKHYPNNPQFNRWAVNNSNNETIAYAYCAQLAETIARLLNADPASGHWAI